MKYGMSNGNWCTNQFANSMHVRFQIWYKYKFAKNIDIGADFNTAFLYFQYSFPIFTYVCAIPMKFGMKRNLIDKYNCQLHWNRLRFQNRLLYGFSADFMVLMHQTRYLYLILMKFDELYWNRLTFQYTSHIFFLLISCLITMKFGICNGIKS